MDELLDELRLLIVERQNIKDLIAKAEGGDILKHTFKFVAESELFENELGQLKGAIASAIVQYKIKINQLIRDKIKEIISA